MEENKTQQEPRGMVCPIDGTPLSLADRQGIEIDYCPKCRGIWLDRGELDKLIERSSADVNRDDPRRANDASYDPRRANDAGYDPRYSGSGGKHGKGRRRGFLGDLFDF